MIRSLLFDLDDTLVRTEPLKALSYARAAVELCRGAVTEEKALDAFGEFVGLAREEVARGLVERLDLARALRARMGELDVREPWEALAKIRRRIYESMLADADLLRGRQVGDAVALAKEARQLAGRAGLASMSHRADVQRLLEVLRLNAAFDVVLSRENVERPKPDPEIYAVAAARLEVPESGCLVIEDSPAGVQAALAAGMRCIAVPTELTRAALLSNGRLDHRWVVEDPRDLRARVLAALGEF